MEVIMLDGQSNADLIASCVALGYFDGIHKGHLALLEQVEYIAKEKGLKKAFMTFDVQPKAFLTNTTVSYLTSLQDKVEILEERGFDYFFVLAFNDIVSHISPQQFIQTYLVNQNIKEVVCGFDYRFGIHGSGNVETLKALANQQYHVTVIPKLQHHQEKVASSNIKSYVMEGNVVAANGLLTRNYCIKGKVIGGFQRGKKELGFATANVDYHQYVLPKYGVYGVLVTCRGKEYMGMANIGLNPTFGDLVKPSLEVHIFDFDETIYGEVIAVSFCYRVRGEQRFSSKEQLIVQLQKDQQAIREKIQQICNKSN